MIRKHLVDFDDVLNKQRDIVYSLRRKILILPEKSPDEFRETIMDAASEEIASLTAGYSSLQEVATDEDIERLTKDVNVLLPVERKEIAKRFKSTNTEELVLYLNNAIEKYFHAKEKKIGKELWMEIARSIFLSTIDTFWTAHLTAIEDLREGINLRGYAQLDPLVEYKNEAFSMFERLVSDIYFEATRRMLKVEIETAAPQEEEKGKPLVYKSASSTNPFIQQPAPNEPAPQQGEEPQGGFKVIPPGTKQRKLGRNDPCWCGSGKKYKKCHYPN